MAFTVRDEILARLLDKQVTVYLMMGVQLKGKLLAFDSTGLKLLTTQYNEESDTIPKIAFIPAHAYSTVI